MHYCSAGGQPALRPLNRQKHASFKGLSVQFSAAIDIGFVEYYFTSTITLGICPLNFDLCSAPMVSTTGVAKSMPTSAVSSAEKIPGCVCSIRPSPDLFPLMKMVPKSLECIKPTWLTLETK